MFSATAKLLQGKIGPGLKPEIFTAPFRGVKTPRFHPAEKPLQEMADPSSAAADSG